MDDFKKRDFIKLSVLAFAGIAMQLPAISLYAQKANAYHKRLQPHAKINWDAFLERLTKLAKTQHLLPWDQKAYTQQVKKLILNCNFPEFENVKMAFDTYEDKYPEWFEHTILHKEIDFQVSLLQFEKGEYISHHNHPDMCGVINMVSGNASVKNYSIEKELDRERVISKNGKEHHMKSCVLKQISSEILTPGNMSILTAHEGNIHSLMPNDFTQLIDVFTPAYHKNTNSTWYDVNEEAFFEGKNHLFEAEYIKK